MHISTLMRYSNVIYYFKAKQHYLPLCVLFQLEKILDTTHGKGTYAIVDVDFR